MIQVAADCQAGNQTGKRSQPFHGIFDCNRPIGVTHHTHFEPPAVRLFNRFHQRGVIQEWLAALERISLIVPSCSACSNACRIFSSEKVPLCQGLPQAKQ